MQLFCISCSKIRKNNELIYIKWFFYRKIGKKCEKIAKKQEKIGPFTTIATNATIAKNTASHRQKQRKIAKKHEKKRKNREKIEKNAKN